MFDFIMTDAQKKLRDEARDFTRWVPREMILAMDAETIQFPHEYLKEAGKRNLLGIRIAACIRRPRPRMGGRRHRRGRDRRGQLFPRLPLGRRRRYRVRGHHPLRLRRTEAGSGRAAPQGRRLRGGRADRAAGRIRLFRGDDNGAEGRRRLDHQRAEALHRRRRGRRLVPGLRGHQSGRAAPPAHDRLHGAAHRGRRKQIHLRAHGSPRRRGRTGHLQRRPRAGALRPQRHQQRVRGLRAHDDPRAAGYRGHDHRLGPARAGNRDAGTRRAARPSGSRSATTRPSDSRSRTAPFSSTPPAPWSTPPASPSIPARCIRAGSGGWSRNRKNSSRKPHGK